MVFRVLLVDDHPLFRKGLRLLLEEEVDLEVVGEAGDGREAVGLVRELAPDAVVMDISMKGLNGIEATRQIISEAACTRVLALSIHSGRRYVEGMLAAGAKGYILKDSAPEDLVEGIRAVTRGEVFLSPAITGIVVSGYKEGLQQLSPVDGSRITSRKKEILRLIVAGDSDAAIAATLGLHEDSVAASRLRLLEEFGANGEEELAETARELGLISDATDVRGGSESMESPAIALATIRSTKLHRPAIPGDHIHRQRLVDLLERGRDLPLTLISAPAGYGKSQLCSSWLESCSLQSSWLSLDDNDDPRRFLQHVLAAVAGLFPHAFETTRSLVGAGNLPPMSILADSLADDLDSIEDRFILVLDDLHSIHGGPIFDLLIELLRHPPRPLHLVLITRRDPSLPLTRYRAIGRMNEVRASDLRFTDSETEALVDRIAGLTLRSDVLDQLERRMEGWIVGLRLVALALRDGDSADDLLTGMGGGLQHIQEYLVQEVLAGQSPQMRDWMLKISILDRFCEPLLSTVCRGGGAPVGFDGEGAEFLTSLRQSNLFTIPLDPEGTWFRYNHLFRELLSDQLERRLDPNEIAELHSRACEWFEGQGLIEEAIGHGFESNDPEMAARIVERNLRSVVNRGPWYLIEKWLSRFSEAEILSRPEFLIGRAYAHSCRMDFSEIPPVLDRIDDLMGGDSGTHSLSREVELFRGMCAFFAADGVRSLEHLERALELTPDDATDLRSINETFLLLAVQMTGHGRRARALATEWLGDETQLSPRRRAYLSMALGHINLIDGDLEAVIWNTPMARKFAETHGLEMYLAWCDYHAGMSYLHRGEFDNAIRCLEATLGCKFHQWKRVSIDTMAGLIIAYQAHGLPEKAVESLGLLREFVSQFGDRAMVFADSCATRLAIMQGRSEQAVRRPKEPTADIDQTMLFFLEIPCITQCRALITEGTAEGLSKAHTLLQEFIDTNESHHNHLRLIELRSLQAMAFHGQAREEEAQKALGQTVELARPGGFVSLFLELGPPMKDLLSQFHCPDGYETFVDRILSGFDPPGGGLPLPRSRQHPKGRPPPEKLTNREFEILELLEQRLFDKEIAVRLHISASTVNSHCKNIYQKLDVSNRRQAVAKANVLGILDGERT